MDFGVLLRVAEPNPHDFRTSHFVSYVLILPRQQIRSTDQAKYRTSCNKQPFATNRPAAVDIFIFFFSNSLSLPTSAILILFLSSRLSPRMLSTLKLLTWTVLPFSPQQHFNLFVVTTAVFHLSFVFWLRAGQGWGEGPHF